MTTIPAAHPACDKLIAIAKTHELKIWPEFFAAVCSGEKTFELRINDRDFKVGDSLLLKEFDPWGHKYSGAEIVAEVTYMIQGLFGLPDNLAVLSIRIAPGQPGYVTRPPYPEPLKVEPKPNSSYYCVGLGGVSGAIWRGSFHDLTAFDSGRCYPATPEGEAHAREAWQARFGEGWK